MKQFQLVLLCALALCLSCTLVIGERRAAAQADNDLAAALEVIARINEWRLEAGVPPLKPNQTLHDLAVFQAAYLRSLPDIQGGNAMHIDMNGQGPRERAAAAPFNWPGYGGNVAIAEIGAVGTLESAFEFWRGSDIHRQTALNSSVREVGAAAVPHPYGHIFIVVFASRPDVLPALVDPRSNTVYLTQDEYKFGPGFVPPMTYRLFDGDGRPLNDGAALDWTPTIPLPQGAGNQFYILYSDGSRETLAEVDLSQDWVLLPGYIFTRATPEATETFAG